MEAQRTTREPPMDADTAGSCLLLGCFLDDVSFVVIGVDRRPSAVA
jgi:hypothetical protein